jgi:predicted metalloprotease with PDZ domain
VKGREWPISVQFAGVPPRWNLATSLPSLSVPAEQPGAPSANVLHAEKYDRLVDSPCELGEFAESDFEQNGGKYRVVIDADAADYDASTLIPALRKITAAETEWMDDRPFATYVFIYHFPRGPAGGGMEHAYSTAIDISAGQLKELRGFESTNAPASFPPWNVKRIRPQSLEPIDYTRENYTRALWFSEGVTSTVADLALLKAGLLTSAEYFERIARGITVLEARPAHLTQSAEESSLDTWFDKYPSYRVPERSISYYNKGDLLGILLDLKMRQDSHGQRSLRDLLRDMNQDYAKRGRFFADSDGVRAEAEKLTHTDLHDFFDQYVAGTAELPYSELFATVGLLLGKQQQSVPDAGFTAARNFNGPLVLDQIYGDQARNAGLREGDEIVSINGEPPARSVDQQIASLKPGTKIQIVVQRRGERKDLELTLGEKSKMSYSLRESPQATPAQLARRAAWLQSEDQHASAVTKAQ